MLALLSSSGLPASRRGRRRNHSALTPPVKPSESRPLPVARGPVRAHNGWLSTTAGSRPLPTRGDTMFDAPTPDISDLRRVCEQPYGFWLDSALADGRLGRSSLCGAEPGLILRSRGPAVELWTRGGTHRFSGSPFQTLRELLRERDGAPGATVGYLAYELKRFVEDVPSAAVDDIGLPECHLGAEEG